MIKKLFQFAIASCLAVTLTACGGDDAPEFAGLWFYPDGILEIDKLEPVEDGRYKVVIHNNDAGIIPQDKAEMRENNQLSVTDDGYEYFLTIDDQGRLRSSARDDMKMLRLAPDWKPQGNNLSLAVYEKYVDDPKGWKAFVERN